MTASWEKIEKNQGVLQVEVEVEKVNTALDKAFHKTAKKINVPGFRKGKVPRPIFEARFGIESLYQDAIDSLLPTVYSDAVKEVGIKPINRPEIDIEQFGKGLTFKFKATVQVKPEVKLGAYKNIVMPLESSEVTQEQVQAELTQLQNRHAELSVIDKGPAQAGDYVSIDFEGFVDGEPFEGGKGEKHSLELGSNSFIPGFEDQIIGMNIAEEKEVQVSFPEDYHAKNLAGKPAVFQVKLHEIKRKNLPQLDDEFAKDISEFDTLEEFKADLVTKMQLRKEEQNKQIRENAIIEKVAQDAELEIPQVLIEDETSQMMKDFETQLQQQQMNLKTYFQLSGQNEEAMKDQMAPEATKRVRTNLVLEEVAKAENFQVTETDEQEELEKLAQRYQRSIEDLRSLFTANGYIEQLKDDLKLRKAVKFIVENSKNE